MRPAAEQGIAVAGRQSAGFGSDAIGAEIGTGVRTAAASLGVRRIGLEAETLWAGWTRPENGLSGGATWGRADSRNAGSGQAKPGSGMVGGLTGWLLTKLRREGRPRPQLAVLERITLAPRQSLTLIETSGQRLLVATSADGTPAFYPVGGSGRQAAVRGKPPARVSLGRVSW
jgi:hypothetical protein